MKECAECTKCCEGHLTLSEVLGKIVPGHDSCPFLNKMEVHGCCLYEHRPQMCIRYSCCWKTDQEIPDYMRPDKSGVIITKRDKYIEILQTKGLSNQVEDFIKNWSPQLEKVIRKSKKY